MIKLNRYKSLISYFLSMILVIIIFFLMWNKKISNEVKSIWYMIQFILGGVAIISSSFFLAKNNKNTKLTIFFGILMIFASILLIVLNTILLLFAWMAGFAGV